MRVAPAFTTPRWRAGCPLPPDDRGDEVPAVGNVAEGETALDVTERVAHVCPAS